MEPTTPINIEVRLLKLDKALDDAFSELDEAEYEFHEVKTRFEIGMAGARIALGSQEVKMTVQEKEDRALVANSEQALALAITEARVKAARANANKLRTQVDIVRSMGASMRASMDL
jgi:hypothetical protein